MTGQLKHKRKEVREDSSVKKWFGRFLLLLSLLGSWLAILTFFPRIAVTPGTQLAAGDIFSTAFNVKNDGFLSFYDVSALCALGKVVTQVKGAPPENTLTYKAMEGQIPTFGFRDSPYRADELQGDASLDAPCAFSVGEDEKVKEANIKIVVIFRPYYLSWWHAARVYTFGSARDLKTGEVHWVSRGAEWHNIF